MKKEVQTFEEAEAVVNPLLAEKKWAVSVSQQLDGSFVIQWVEHKKYTAQDGKEFYDEVWTTREGEMKLIQDLEPEHARNIIRMILRKDRESAEKLNSLFKMMTEEFMDDDETDDDSFVAPEPEKKILH